MDTETIYPSIQEPSQSSPARTTAALIMPLMQATKRGADLGDTGWLTEEEEEGVEGGRQMFDSQLWADEINPSSEAETDWKVEAIRVQLASLFPLRIE